VTREFESGVTNGEMGPVKRPVQDMVDFLAAQGIT